jgi:hypothetical protein
VTSDVLLLDFSWRNGSAVLTHRTGQAAPAQAFCAGSVKVAQRWALEFYTELGSIPHRAGRGCTFLRAAREGRLGTELDVHVQFALAMATLEPNIVSDEAASAADDERYAGCDLDAVLTHQRFLSLHVTVRTVAASARTLTLPVPVM